MPKCIFGKDNRPGQTGEFAPPEEGLYCIVIEEATDKDEKGGVLKSSNGNEMIKLTCACADETDYKGKFWENLVFTVKAIWKIRQVLVAVGYQIEEDEKVAVDVSPCNFDEKHSQAWVRIEHSEYRGKVSGKIAEWLTPEDVEKLVGRALTDEDTFFPSSALADEEAPF